jgi:V-type H+-transporting ATPase subunit a
MKMKMSIIMGVTQMMVGIFMSLLNFVHAKDVLSIACECIPQVIFLGALFGYLVFLIVLKWITPGCEADLYHVLIYMFLSPGIVDCAGEGPGGTAGCPENVMFRGQGVLQVCLVVVAFASVPVMLLPKPLVLKRRRDARARGRAYARLPGEDNCERVPPSPPPADDDGEAFNFGDVFVHQMIHTIEFVLGAVSNTASYLRLWALSLAHAQLGAVFWDRVLTASVATRSPLAMLVGFVVWAVATIGVLMLMESLSAFLHALRLHWVEYQNKFYKGDGYAFDPFSFERILKEAAAEGS